MTPRRTVVSSPGDLNDVVEWGSADDTVRVVRLGEERRSVPTAEFRDSAEAFQARIDSIPVPLDRMRGMSDAARNGRLPHLLPSVLALHVDAAGNIWLRRWPPAEARNQTIFDVLGGSGALLRSVVVPGDLQLDPPPFVSSRFVAGVIMDPATRVERVAVYRVLNR
jgi:hypothetical protein